MKFTLGWLKQHLDTDATVDQVADTLNAIGLEVEGIDNPAEKLSAFRIARVLTAAPHPQADKLQVLSVDAGDGPLQVVCGAPNARAGLVGVFGAPGAVVPSNGMVLKVAAIRGVESNGMMCSVRELELGDEHDGIIELPADAPVGASFAGYAGIDDPVFDVAVTPNRQDCMGVRGIARDLAAAGLGTLKPLAVPEIVGNGPSKIEIRTDDAEGCPAFYGRTISGVTNGTAPEWMARRLKAVGQRSISTLVDITNYVMLDLGRPSHAYDMAKLSGALVARRATDGETVTVLNGKTYTLTPEMTVIADANEVHDVAGIMGGEHSGIADDTTDVLLEVAYFTPEGIAKTGQTLALTSDARTRFERGVDPAFLEDAVAILTGLIVEHCGGAPSEMVRAGSPPLEVRTLSYDPGLCAQLGGIDVRPDRQRAILDRLGFAAATDWTVTIPSWRRDVDGPADLVEEVVRIVGLDNIVSTPLPRTDGVARPTATADQKLERRMRRTAASLGLNEAITWSFISENEAAAVGGGHWVLENPISEELKVMRPSLLPGLLSAARRNLDRGADSVRLFEIGRRYLADGEHPTLVLVMAGERAPRDWQGGKAKPFDAYDAKALCIELLRAAGAPVDNLQVMGEAGNFYHPGQSATLRLGPKTVLASFGVIHPTTAKAFGIDGPVVAAGIHLDAIPTKRETGFMRAAYTPPALQVVRRDFAFLVPLDLASDTLVRAVKGADKGVIADARLFDMFTGTGVPEGQKSLAVEVTLQPVDKSFTEDDLTAIAAKVVAAAAKLGAVLRG
ncbi:phenylalanine--tRNA ligase subunit beta [Sphingomonas sp. SUN039]|uniref:phenylalanine--tRNA ligase subunit beta n=1 Tax=Sphingomonas sp. SUN039 TaxID=2937787 RepID=UPI002164C74C|nr:phenylalanine--tRNA ligase subunit beta [Sphingomonas sp. SUN039]UVO55159.1 phenylalanine--tRNA ligase subunit beta [Sphingomonas sp. SUN039]